MTFNILRSLARYGQSTHAIRPLSELYSRLRCGIRSGGLSFLSENKIFNRIQDQKLKQNINIFITGYFNRIMEIFDELIEELYLEINNFKPDSMNHVEKLVEFLYEMIIDLYSIFYFLSMTL